MKALKEKRISLRSLWRRGLVILSLFALLFAVGCSETGSDENKPDPGPNPGPDADYVEYMRVVRHPNRPSYQGAPPELNGLVVELTWHSGKVELEPNNELFTVSPSTCLIPTKAYTTGKKWSEPGAYKVQYTYGPSRADPVSVYIPYVTALTWPQPTGLPKGSVEEVYQDMGYKPGAGGTFTADYEEVPFFTAGEYPPDTWESEFKGWPDYEDLDNPKELDAGERTWKVVADDSLWTLALGGNISDGGDNQKKANADYYLGLAGTPASNKVIAKLEIKNYYYVDFITVNGFKKQFPSLRGDQDLKDDIKWLELLQQADPDIVITYYPEKTRGMPMWEFSNALNKANPLANRTGAPTGGGAAAAIKIVGGNSDGTNEDKYGNKMAVSLFADYIEEGSPVVARLYYYSNDITIKPGEVYVTKLTNPTNTSWPNYGPVNITDTGAIMTFTRLEKERRKGIEGDRDPEVRPSSDTGDTTANLNDQKNNFVYTLFTYWSVVQVWESPTDSTREAIRRPVPIGANSPVKANENGSTITGPNTMKTKGTPPGAYPLETTGDYVIGLGEWPDYDGIADFENEDPEGGKSETRTATLYFQLPVTGSDTNKAGTTIEWGELNFDYIVMP